LTPSSIPIARYTKNAIRPACESPCAVAHQANLFTRLCTAQCADPTPPGNCQPTERRPQHAAWYKTTGPANCTTSIGILQFRQP
jgi:hypothetical protein